jgi:hypothetical protein
VISRQGERSCLDFSADYGYGKITRKLICLLLLLIFVATLELSGVGHAFANTAFENWQGFMLAGDRGVSA